MTIFLSPPDVGPVERELLLAAFDSNWIAPVGPDLSAFEQEFASAVGMPHAVAVASGTAALHLLLHTAGIGPGDVVLVPTFTFAATAFAVAYTGATPIFIDSEAATWNVDPSLVEEAIDQLDRRGERPKALLAVDLYGRCADYERLEKVCAREGLLLIEDAAEALGATTVIDGTVRRAGSFGAAAAFSFNGNKIITTSGGGMVVTADGDLAERVRYLSTQARQPVSHYEHLDIGFNYRMSNLLAALGRGQLRRLNGKVARRREINRLYREALGDLPGVSFDPAVDGRNCWLTCIVIDPGAADGVDRVLVEARLREVDIESRPLWKPMHRQPVFVDAPAVLNGVSDELFSRGLCVPSGSSLTAAELDRVISEIRACWGA
jgi:dTDP-4-amino-4,6-dideoxygalactose transaminase